ncbi:MAG: prepilin-type N-terminal cleavage/methylation domain-containing protein [Methylococcales bacterium]
MPASDTKPTIKPVKRQQGFTLVELVMIIVVLGILSVTASPKFFGVSEYQVRAFFDDTLSAIRYAQKLAVANHCKVQVSINANGYTLKRPATESQCFSSSPTFSVAVTHPGTQQAGYSNSQADVTLTPNTSFYFDALGQASQSVTLTVGGTRTITVIPATGFVYGS